MKLVRTHWALVGPVLLVILIALVGTLTTTAFQFQVQSVLVTAAIVVSLYVFVGNSGVLSFGHISFVALGAFSAGILSMPAETKGSTFPELFTFLADTEVGNLTSLAIATLVGGVAALVVGIPLMRLSGLSAGIATFAVLVIVNNILRNWERIGPGAKTLPLVPRTTGFIQATTGLILVMIAAYLYQRSRAGRMMRAAREDPAAALAVGIDEHRQRIVAFTLSGALCGLAGGLFVHLLGSITTQQVYFDLTFITLAVLVVGGVGSLWGALIGGLGLAGLNAVLAEGERGASFLGLDVTIPAGSRLVLIGAIMFLALMLRPDGITRGRELQWPFRNPDRTGVLQPGDAPPPPPVATAPSEKTIDEQP